MKDGTLPTTGDEIGLTLAALNLNFSGGDIGEGSEKPKLLGKFAAVVTLLARGDYADATPHLEYILLDRPQSALAHFLLRQRASRARTLQRGCGPVSRSIEM